MSNWPRRISEDMVGANKAGIDKIDGDKVGKNNC